VAGTVLGHRLGLNVAVYHVGKACCSHSEHYKWSIDNYGPYRLPYKGMQVALSPENIRLYGRLMQIEANNLSEIEADSSGSFTFNKDYYFIMGDHFHDSEDSRYFGPVREENKSFAT
jgi:signal peptidase I